MINKAINYLFILVTLFGSCASFSNAELTEEQAFSLRVRVVNNQLLEFHWDIAPDHYLYKNQIALINSNNISLIADNTLPTGKNITDHVLGNYVVYANQLIFTIPWHATAIEKNLILRYQGCAKDSFCYLPISKKIIIKDNNEIDVQETNLQKFPEDNPTNKLATMIQDRFLPITLLIFFCLGILLSLTPCVLPMIPIIVNLIVGQKTISSRKAFFLSSSYVLGMSCCYAIAGIIAGMLGATLQAWLQQPIVLIGLSLLLVVLALAQFDLIHLSLPHFNTRLHHWGQRQLQGSVFGAFILGFLAALIVSPCITPPLIGALTYISQNGNPLIGGLTLFSLGLGMGIPLIFVALLSSIILPKSGPWMNVVKSIAGLALLGLAIWLLQRIIPMYIAVVLWGVLCIIAAIRFKPKKTTKILKPISLLLCVLGAALIMNAVYIEFIAQNNVATTQTIIWKDITTVSELEESLFAAKNKQQFTLLEFYADWCTSCKKIEATVFTNPEVIKNLTNFSLLRVDMTNMNAVQKDLLSSLEVYGPPAILLFDKNGAEIESKRIIGEVSSTELLDLIRSTNTNHPQ